MSEPSPDQAYEDMLAELKAIIQSQIQELKKSSEKGKLSVSDNRTLLELIRQVKQLAQEELQTALQMSDERLIRIATRERVSKHRKKNESLLKDSDESSERPEARAGEESE